MQPLLNESGQPFAPLSLGSSPLVVPPDPEGIAFDRIRERLYWSSEGERITDVGPVLLDPWIRVAGLDGRYLGQFTMPPVWPCRSDTPAAPQQRIGGPDPDARRTVRLRRDGGTRV